MVYEPEADDPPLTPGQQAWLLARREPGRGRSATWPSQIPPRGWRDILWRVIYGYFGDWIGAVAGGVAYLVLLSLFPALAAFISLYGLFFDVSQVREQLSMLAGVLPRDVLSILGTEMARLAGSQRAGLTLAFAASVLLALWSAMAAVKVLFRALNVAYQETERRNFVRVNLTALLFTLGMMVFMAVVVGAVIVTPAVFSFWGLNSERGPALLRWPILLAANMIVLSVLYRYGPSRELPRWRWVTWGGAFASVLWLGASAAYSWYLSHMANYQATYGSLGAFMGFLVWIWLSVVVVLLGAKLNAEMEHQTARDTTTGAEEQMGDRGAVVADTLGLRKGMPGAKLGHQAAAEMAKRLQQRRTRRKLRQAAGRDAKPGG